MLPVIRKRFLFFFVFEVVTTIALELELLQA